MPRYKISVHGLDNTLEKLSALDWRLALDLRTVVQANANRLEREAKARCPVRTGNLRNSIKAETHAGGLNADVGPRKPDGWYAHFLEWGTVKMAARPFMGPAWEAVRPRYIADVTAAVARALKR